MLGSVACTHLTEKTYGILYSSIFLSLIPFKSFFYFNKLVSLNVNKKQGANTCAVNFGDEYFEKILKSVIKNKMGKKRKKKKLNILRFLMTDGSNNQSDLSDDSEIAEKDIFGNAAINSLVSGLEDDEIGKL